MHMHEYQDILNGIHKDVLSHGESWGLRSSISSRGHLIPEIPDY